jgi:outer membrane biogenesis lipoprotein LolB
MRILNRKKMKQLLLIFAIAFLTACGSSTEKEVDENLEVTTEKSKNLEEAQDLNIELEEIDGELDSLLTKTD